MKTKLTRLEVARLKFVEKQCDEQDRSTEYMMQAMVDAIQRGEDYDTAFDKVMAFLQADYEKED